MRNLRVLLVVAVLAIGGFALVARGSGSSGGADAGGPTTASTTAAAVSGAGAAQPVTTPSTASTPSTTAPLPIVAPEIETMADRAAMTDEAQRLFYEADPQLVDKVQLGASCPLRAEVSVLGCYGSGQITILRVDDPRLDGMMETTAAHEMLHAAWVELAPAERDALATGLQAQYGWSDDADLIDKIESYRDADPSVVDNELHSILGTEVAELSPELEAYYTRWFDDRSQVVALAEASQSTFQQLEAEVEALDIELDSLRGAIDAEDTRLDTELQAIQALAAELDRLEAEQRFDEYNAAVPDYNARVDTYNSAAMALQTQVEEFNALVEQRNQLATEWSELMEPIDTSLETVNAGNAGSVSG